MSSTTAWGSVPAALAAPNFWMISAGGIRFSLICVLCEALKASTSGCVNWAVEVRAQISIGSCASAGDASAIDADRPISINMLFLFTLFSSLQNLALASRPGRQGALLKRLKHTSAGLASACISVDCRERRHCRSDREGSSNRAPFDNSNRHQLDVPSTLAGPHLRD